MKQTISICASSSSDLSREIASYKTTGWKVVVKIDNPEKKQYSATLTNDCDEYFKQPTYNTTSSIKGVKC